jgi:hypothetical protein
MFRARLQTIGALALCSAVTAADFGSDRSKDPHPVSCGIQAISGTKELTNQVPTELPGQNLPIVREHSYRMDGRIRVLLLWMGREDVGTGVIKWRAGEGEHAFELLIGSDPDRAPRQLNKWGYLVEHIRGVDSFLVGLISQSTEVALGDVTAGLESAQQQRAFDTIRGRVTSGEACARVGTLYAAHHLTARDAHVVLAHVFQNTSLPLKRIERSQDVRGGFLSSIDELIGRSIARAKPGTAGAESHSHLMRPIPYVHGDRLYELRVLESKPLASFSPDGRNFEKVIRARFETRELGARSGTRFELVYGASGAMAGIPIVISYQPRWWLYVDLVLKT